MLAYLLAVCLYNFVITRLVLFLQYPYCNVYRSRRVGGWLRGRTGLVDVW